MKTIRLSLTLLLCLLGSGCVIDARTKDVAIGPERRLALPVTDDSDVSVRIPIGEIEVIAGNDDQLRIDLLVLCPSQDSACARRLADLEFVTREDDDGSLRIRLSRNAATSFRDAHLRASVQVPPVRKLSLDVSAGELSVGPVDACVEVDMGAGDVNVRARAVRYSNVDLDAGIGDASLAVDGRRLRTRRSLLVGAEVAWHEGRGECDMLVDLQTGNISVALD
ncbi:MAG: hypothetical protein AAGB27_14045 [Pseudomonadota bacterium]